MLEIIDLLHWLWPPKDGRARRYWRMGLVGALLVFGGGLLLVLLGGLA